MLKLYVVGMCTGKYGDLIFTKQYVKVASWPAVKREQAKVAEKFKDLGSMVTSHGAFLNLDGISLFPTHHADCEKVAVGRWNSGVYTEHENHALQFHSEKHMHRTGLIIFEHLCMLSYNRAGIIVTIPSSKYIKEHCTGLAMVNRHTAPTSDDNAHHQYSVTDLKAMIVDMAKWGVSRYSLGYLDYTYRGNQRVSTFSQLTNAITSATRAHRNLHYRYTRSSKYGDGGYSYAMVSDVYKLEGGMFFQFTQPSSPMLKSFVRVPGYPNLRLGMSSDMNVGAAVSGLEPTGLSTIEKVKFVPYGAEVITLKNGEKVFVDQERGIIRMHAPPASYNENIRLKCH